ncbi:Peroxidase 65 [Linum grandiflorum]
MATRHHSFILLSITVIFLSTPLLSNSQLSLDYYKTTCPQFNEIVADVVTTKQISNPTTAAASLRIFFHDCMVDGCDASVLVAPNTFKKVERDNELDSDLPGDGFDVVTRAKTALELACPKTVSCADILAEAARDLVVMVGGPNYPVLLGRKDSLVSMSTSYTKDPTMSAFNDLYTPGKFDNMYYQNLLKGMGLLATDQMMMDDPRTKKFVTLYAANQTAFFDDFSKAMEKLSVLDVKIGNEGDVRNRCDEFNTVKA